MYWFQRWSNVCVAEWRGGWIGGGKREHCKKVTGLSQNCHNQLTSNNCWLYFYKILFFQTFPPITAMAASGQTDITSHSLLKRIITDAPPEILLLSPAQPISAISRLTLLKGEPAHGKLHFGVQIAPSPHPTSPQPTLTDQHFPGGACKKWSHSSSMGFSSKEGVMVNYTALNTWNMFFMGGFSQSVM